MVFSKKLLRDLFHCGCAMQGAVSRHWVPWTGNALSRRSLFKLGLALCAAAHAIGTRPAIAGLADLAERDISFFNIHTGESLSAAYWTPAGYDPGVLDKINHILRDHRTDEVKPIEPRLLDLLYLVRRSLETAEPYHVISGYRGPATNGWLASRSRGVVKNSLHLLGWAADVRLTGRSLSALRQAALNLQGGGVGYYPASGFVHIDVGRVRSW